MGNKVKFNLKNVHAAKLTESVVQGVKTYTYATPVAIPGAVSISFNAEGESKPFYADGIVYFRSNTNNGYSGDLEMALIPTVTSTASAMSCTTARPPVRPSSRRPRRIRSSPARRS